jgi:hypothetical protein
MYCWDESWQGYGNYSIVQLVNWQNTRCYRSRTDTGNDVNGVLYGGKLKKLSSCSRIVSSRVIPSAFKPIYHHHSTPSTVITYKLPLFADPNAPYTTPLQFETFYMAAPGPDIRQMNGLTLTKSPRPHRKIPLRPDLGADAIHTFAIDTASGDLNDSPDDKTGSGDGPRHGEW